MLVLIESVSNMKTTILLKRSFPHWVGSDLLHNFWNKTVLPITKISFSTAKMLDLETNFCVFSDHSRIRDLV